MNELLETRRFETSLEQEFQTWVVELIRTKPIDDWGHALVELFERLAKQHDVWLTPECYDEIQRWMLEVQNRCAEQQSQIKRRTRTDSGRIQLTAARANPGSSPAHHRALMASDRASSDTVSLEDRGDSNSTSTGPIKSIFDDSDSWIDSQSAPLSKTSTPSSAVGELTELAFADEVTYNASNYRQHFRDQSPMVPGNWRIHHTYQQALRERYLNERGINVDDPKHLRALPEKYHEQITAAQTKWWASWKDKEINGVKITAENAKALVPLEEVDKFMASIEKQFDDVWVKAGNSYWRQRKIDRIMKKIGLPLIKDAADRGRALLKGLGIGGVLGIINHVILAQDILAMDRRPEYQDLMTEYRLALVEQDKPEGLSQSQALDVIQAFERLCRAINMDPVVLGELSRELRAAVSHLR